MEMLLLSLVVAVLAAVVVVGVLLVRTDRSGVHPAEVSSAVAGALDAAVRDAVTQARREAADERDAAIRAAVDQSVQVSSAIAEQQQSALASALDAIGSLGKEHRDASTEAARQTIERALESTKALGEQTQSAVAEMFEAKTNVMGLQVGEVKQQMAELRAAMTELEQQRASHMGMLDQQLQRLSSTTGTLAEVLASPKTRGQWGERMAEDLLRHLGMVEGVNYRRQTRNSDGKVPDITFLLPDQRVLHMDVKFPIDSYVRWTQATTEDDADRHKTEFLKAVRARVRELKGRSYIDPSDGTVDHVLCFVPNEAIYAFICEHGMDVVDEALADKVLLCSPANLYGLLSVIRQSTEILQVERTSDEVLSLLGAFDKQWDKFTEALDKVARNFATVHRSFEDVNGTRRRQLEKPLNQLQAVRQQRGVDVALGYDVGAGAEVIPALRAVGDDNDTF